MRDLDRELELELGAGWEMVRDMVAGVLILLVVVEVPVAVEQVVLLVHELGAGWEVAVVGMGAWLGLVTRTGGASAMGAELVARSAGLTSHLLDVKWAGLTSHLFLLVCPLSSSSPFI